MAYGKVFGCIEEEDAGNWIIEINKNYGRRYSLFTFTRFVKVTHVFSLDCWPFIRYVMNGRGRL